MTDQTTIDALTAERFNTSPPDPIPTVEEKRLLTAAQLGRLETSSGGWPVMRTPGGNQRISRGLVERLLHRKWIARADHRLPITAAGQAALARRHTTHPVKGPVTR